MEVKAPTGYYGDWTDTPTPTPVPAVPQTGDNTNLPLLVTILGGSLAGLGLLIFAQFCKGKSLPAVIEPDDIQPVNDGDTGCNADEK